LRQTADARTTGDDRTTADGGRASGRRDHHHQTGTVGTAAPGTVEEAKGAAGTVHAAAAVATVAAAARPAPAQEDGQRG